MFSLEQTFSDIFLKFNSIFYNFKVTIRGNFACPATEHEMKKKHPKKYTSMKICHQKLLQEEDS